MDTEQTRTAAFIMLRRRLGNLALLAIAGAIASDRYVGAAFFTGPTPGASEPMFFSIYSVAPLQRGNANMAKVAAGGFTSAGPYYGNESNPTIDSNAFYSRISQAQDHQLGYVAHIPDHPAVVNDVSGQIRPNSMLAISEASLRSHVRSVMDYTLSHPDANATVKAWYIQPEEMRPWMSPEMNYLRIIAEEVHSYDPLSRPVTMYNPNHRSIDQLATISSQGLDWTMMGVYSTPVPFSSRGARIADGVTRIIAAAESTSTVPVAVYQLSEDYQSADLMDLRTALGGATQAAAIKHVIRHDVYQGLIRGTQGVQIWSGCDCRNGLTTFSEQLDGYISVSNDLNGDLSLSDIFMQGDRRNDLQASVLLGPPTVTYEEITVNTLGMANIAYGDSRFLFLVNSSNSEVVAEVNGLPIGEPQIIDLFGNQADLRSNNLIGELRLNLAPLEVIALKLTAVWNADADADGFVDGNDLLIWQRGLGSSDGGPSNGDFNYDGRVDGDDLTGWQGQFAAISGDTNATSVPEPATFILLAFAGWAISGRRSVYNGFTITVRH